MANRVEGKIAVVVGAGQTEGETVFLVSDEARFITDEVLRVAFDGQQQRTRRRVGRAPMLLPIAQGRDASGMPRRTPLESFRGVAESL